MKILIVEDEPKTAAYLNRGLSENGFTGAGRPGNGEAQASPAAPRGSLLGPGASWT